MADLPLVLAGPILRRVDLRHVCVWLALSQSSEVTVTVFAGRQTSTGAGTSTGPALGSQKRSTRQFGAKLHIVVVDVEVVGLIPGSRFCYDVVVKSGAGEEGLKGLGLLKDGTGTPKPLALGYATDVLPSFVTAAADVKDLRIAHSSCRKSNGEGPDALAWLDDRIEEGLSSMDKAPQQLFMTGDQIYADEVGAVLLSMLGGLASDLVGPEKLPVGGALIDATQDRFPPLRRQGTARMLARFSTEAGANHLFTFGEFAAMYCAAFSPRVWRDLPAAASLFKDPPADAAATHVTNDEGCPGDPVERKTKALKGVQDEAELVEQWRDAVPKVARALANVPTFMICDDHEVTDDWNISPRWRDRVVTAPFGRAVMRNALMAYAVFQGWGNDPAIYRHDGAVAAADVSPNETLLDRATELTGNLQAPTSAMFENVDKLVGLDATMSDAKCVFHYQVPGPAHMVHVLDTRTKRGYRGKIHSPPMLLGSSMDKQLPKGPLADGRQLLVVISPVPVLFPQLIDALVQPAAGLVFDMATHMFGREDIHDPCKPVAGLVGTEHRDIEGWHADEQHHEQFLRRLGTYQRVVVLSGDVHFASSLVLDFWGKGDEKADSRIVQLTSSASRNQPEDKIRAVIRTLSIGQQLLRGGPSERIAWELDHGVVLPPGAQIRPGRRARLRRKPALLPAHGWPAGTTLTSPPDWRWRLTVLRDERPKADLPPGAPDIPVLNWNDADPLASYADIMGSHQKVALDPKDPSRLMVFRNNIGLVSFAADGADFRVAHTILSSADDDTGDAFTEHRAAFATTPPPTAPQLMTS